MYPYNACWHEQGENQLADTVDGARVANSRRSGFCILFSGGYPQKNKTKTWPTHVSFKGLKGKEIATNMHTANVLKAALCQASSCYRVAPFQSSSKHSTAT